MPSVITHAVVAAAAGKAFVPKDAPRDFWPLTLGISMLPDADVLAFVLGIPYEHFFGHRGFFHSIFFSLLAGAGVAWLLLRGNPGTSRGWRFFFVFYGLLAASHGILDACTDGGLGIALLSPFDATRYFFPWTPLPVSPIGIRAFCSEWGYAVIKGECLWVWLPCSALVAASAFLRRARQ